MIERKRFLSMLSCGLIGGLFVNPFKDKEEWVWFRMYDYEGNFKGWEHIDVASWVHPPKLEEGLGYGRLVTKDGTYVADSPAMKYERALRPNPPLRVFS